MLPRDQPGDLVMETIAERQFHAMKSGHEGFSKSDVPEVIREHLQIAAARWAITLQPDLWQRGPEARHKLGNQQCSPCAPEQFDVVNYS